MLMIQLKHAIMIMPNGDQWPIDIVLLPTIYSTTYICFMTLNTRKVWRNQIKKRRLLKTLVTGSPIWCSPNISPSWLLLVTCVQVWCWCPGDVPRVYHGPGVTSPHCPSQICFSFLHSSTRDPCLLTPALRTPLHILDKINIWKYKYVESDISCSITWLHPT